MKTFIASAVLWTLSAALLFETEWQDFKSVYNISYRSFHHESKRREIFEKNLHKINQHNLLYERGLKSYKLGITPFSDLTNEEYKEMLRFQRVDSRANINTFFQIPEEGLRNIPEAIDWRNKGAVTNVKQQGICGSCWAFSVTGSVEAQYYLKHGQLVSFSEQQLVDCAVGGDYDCDGCFGGEIDGGFRYVRDKGLESESDYSYVMTDNNQCVYNDQKVVTKIEDYVAIEMGDEEALLAAVASVGPVSVAVDASSLEFQLYKDGIFQNAMCNKTELDHAVLVVGYGRENGLDYWIVKNSWGRGYGIDGYIHIRRGVNECGIATEASYPVL